MFSSPLSTTSPFATHQHNLYSLFHEYLSVFSTKRQFNYYNFFLSSRKPYQFKLRKSNNGSDQGILLFLGIFRSRIVMPLSMEEYQIAQMYVVMKMQQQNTKGTEGVEVLENKSFEDDELGKGQYTLKLYRLQSKVPSWLTAFAPPDALVMQEEAWNAYPRCKSVVKCPYFGRMVITIDTIHKGDNGRSENVHGLSHKQLAARKVEVIDISSSPSDYWSYIVGRSNVDFSTFQSARTGRGPLPYGWKEHCNPVMTAYKLVTIDVPYWGFGRRLEQALIAGERALFLESHRNGFAWIDEWFGMIMEMMRELERESDSSLNEKFDQSC